MLRIRSVKVGTNEAVPRDRYVTVDNYNTV